jgi:hypothetical protein
MAPNPAEGELARSAIIDDQAWIRGAGVDGRPAS